MYDEEFDGNSLNTDNWYIEVVPQSHNNELQYYTDSPDNIAVQDGRLVITPLKEKYAVSSTNVLNILFNARHLLKTSHGC